MNERKRTIADRLEGLYGLEGRVAAVTGAAGHLCGVMCEALAACGASVAVIDRDDDGRARVVDKIREAGGSAIDVSADVTKKHDHEESLRRIVDEFGKVDILINGAGINASTPFLEITEEEWHAILDSHVTATMLACQVFGSQMVENKYGSIINMSSASSGPPLSKAFSYSVAKAGIKNLTQNLAREWALFNVRVNALKPGFFPTEWSKEHFIDEAREAAILGHTPMGRYGRPEELVSAVIWLCSDSAGFVTGAEIAVDGGFSCMTI